MEQHLSFEACKLICIKLCHTIALILTKNVLEGIEKFVLKVAKLLEIDNENYTCVISFWITMFNPVKKFLFYRNKVLTNTFISGWATFKLSQILIWFATVIFWQKKDKKLKVCNTNKTEKPFSLQDDSKTHKSEMN